MPPFQQIVFADRRGKHWHGSCIFTETNI